MRRVLWVYLILSIVFAASLGVGEWFSFGYDATVWLVSFQRVLVVLLVGLPAFGLSRVIFSPVDAFVGGGIIWAMLLFAVDSYSYGIAGGHWGFQVEHRWQIALTIVLAGLLLSGAVLIRARQFLFARIILAAESIGFFSANAIYILRDGLATRSFEGYEDSPLPLLAFVLGAALRILIQARLLAK